MTNAEDSGNLLRFKPAPEDFLKPLDLIEAEHARQHRIRDSFEQGGDDIDLGDLTASAGDLLRFLTVDLALHHADEEEDFFPLLVSRAQKEDDLERRLSQLAKEHELDEDLIGFVCADLEKLAGGLGLANPTRFMTNLGELFESQRRHLENESQVILPLARQRLSTEDQLTLGRSMARRRGIAFPG